MASFLAPASARHPSTLVDVLPPHHRPATRRISNLHLPPAGLLCSTRPYTISRSGCRVASSSPVLPLRTPVDESLGYSRASRRRTRRPLLVLPGAAAADKDDGCKELHIEGGSGSGKSPFTPIVLNKILFGRLTDFAKICLVRHVFTAVLPRDKQLQLLEFVYQHAFPEINKQESKVFSKNWLTGDEKLEAGYAMAQIYMEMNKYKDAEQVLKRLVEEDIPPKSDGRVHLLNAVVKVMLAVDLLTSKCNALTEKELKGVHDLIVEFKDCYDKYKEAIASGPNDIPQCFACKDCCDKYNRAIDN